MLAGIPPAYGRRAFRKLTFGKHLGRICGVLALDHLCTGVEPLQIVLGLKKGLDV